MSIYLFVLSEVYLIRRVPWIRAVPDAICKFKRHPSKVKIFNPVFYNTPTWLALQQTRLT